MLKNKIHPSNCGELMGFIKQFINRAAYLLASREMPQRATERERFSKAEQGSHKKKKNTLDVISFIWGQKGLITEIPLGDGEDTWDLLLSELTRKFLTDHISWGD